MIAACSGGGSGDREISTANFTANQLNQPSLLAAAPDIGIFMGAAVADEPRAALAARNVLEQGGTAADAATALYFTLAVTMPHAAGLGGGGVCLVHDPDEQKVTSYDFLPRRARGGGPAAIPGNVRGFAYIQATHGRLNWANLVAPAEVMAAQGHEVSRAFVSEMAPLTGAIRSLPNLASVYLKPDGQPLAEGDRLVQTGLAASLGRVRAGGPSGLYAGDIAEAVAEEAATIGGTITIEELRAYRPNVREPQQFPIGNHRLSVPSAEIGAGQFMAALWPYAQGTGGGALAQAARAELARLGAERDLPSLYGSTAFTVANAGGDAIACAVTMNGPFGTGRMAPGTGISLARSPDTPGYGLASAFLAPVLVTNPNNGTFFFAGAGSGSEKAPAGVLSVASKVMGGTSLDEAQLSGISDRESLVNAVACPSGAPQENASCGFAPDPRGDGIGALGYPAGY